MEQENVAPGYHIWGVDNTPYGPVELPTLVHWIKDERVLGDTWIYCELDRNWCKASEITELRMFFKPKNEPAGQETLPATGHIDPGMLRRIKVLTEMTDEQLRALLRLVEILPVRPFTHLVHKGEPGDALFGVLEGELRSCILIEGKECPLATLGPGSVFGEISLFDKGPHAADVLANEESLLLKISAAALANIAKETPDTARALLFGLIKALAGRVRTLTKRYEDSVQAAQRFEPISSI